ncbi:4-hydroxy-2-oxoglutarate aldolase [Purpureocillium lavendulum]|uniref:4-hydroxy-2-oxoglutarate aldolase n=1 Tax=Purpureocillium lavendulum TaxID=1247861 RepID=A0AB34G1D0_9HYPO|nr:4-hydroxy-2-oxoglutarate aldolase [Purpureocillium lavendulum]
MSNGQYLRLRPGVYAPVPTPFKDDGTGGINLAAFDSIVSRIGKAGVGVLVGGTLGEGPLLERDERTTLVRSAKKTLRDAGCHDETPVIVGIFGASVRECVAQAHDAASAGADAVIVVAPAYFAFVYGKDKTAVAGFFSAVADDSPLPVMIYNIPFAAGGIDLDAQTLIGLSYVSVKLSCVKLYQTAVEALDTRDFGLLLEAQQLQDLITTADSVINKAGFLGIKTAMCIHVDDKMSGGFRKPLQLPGTTVQEDLRSGLQTIFNHENTL